MAARSWDDPARLLPHHRGHRGRSGGNVTRIWTVVKGRNIGGEFLGLLDQFRMLLDESCAQFSGAEIGALQNGAVVADSRRGADHDKLAKRAARTCNGLCAIASMHD